MNALEVVREALDTDWSDERPLDYEWVRAALDSLEAELAQERRAVEIAAEGIDGLRAELAHIKHELVIAQDGRTAAHELQAEAEAKLAEWEATNTLWHETWKRELREAREERDRYHEGMRSCRDGSDCAFCRAFLVARAALTGETDHVFHAEGDGTIPDAYPVATGESVTIEWDASDVETIPE